MDTPIDVLLVDGDAEVAARTAEHLEWVDEGLQVETVTDGETATERLASGEYDCVVSDHELPGTDGLELLRTVRDRYDELPFVLFTGTGSEAVASAAISAGVSEYLRKGTGTEQLTLLANSVRNVVERHRAQQALAGSQERLALFVEQSPLGVIEYDERFEIVSVNPAAESILGYDAEELVGGSWVPFVPEDDRRTVAEVTRQLLADHGGYHSINENVRKDGETIVCEWHNRVITDDDDTVVSVVSQFQDVTERYEEREARRESEERYRLLVEHFPNGGVFLFDEDLRCTLAGGAGLAEVGLTPEDVVGETPRDVFPAELAGELERYYRAALAGEEHVFEQSYMGNHYRDITLPVRGEDGSVVEGMAVSQDITERVERERRLERLHEATRELVAAPSREAIAERVVAAAEEVLGFSVALVRFHDPDRGGLVPVAVSDAAREAFEDRPVVTPDGGSLNWTAYETGTVRRIDDVDGTEWEWSTQPSLGSLLVVPIGDHGTLSVSESTQGAFDETDEFLGRILATAAESALDAVAREAQLRDRRDELERQNDRLDEFASVVSHDLRNPLAVAEGHLALAREEHDSEHLGAVERAHERMETLIENVLALARQGGDAHHIEPLGLRAVAELAWGNVDTDGATLVAPDEGMVAADHGSLQQLLENLFRNAIEHAGAGVVVTVGALGEAGFFVEDDGPGVPAGERDRVFETGYSSDSGGTGFGLTIVERIAEAHGWDVRLTEGREGGARFEFEAARG